MNLLGHYTTWRDTLLAPVSPNAGLTERRVTLSHGRSGTNPTYAATMLHPAGFGRGDEEDLSQEPTDADRVERVPGGRWLSVHPNGPNTPSYPVYAVPDKSGQYVITGGAGGRLNGLRLDGLQDEAAYARTQSREESARRRLQRYVEEQSRQQVLMQAQALAARRDAGEVLREPHLLPMTPAQALEYARILHYAHRAQAAHAEGDADTEALAQLAPDREDLMSDPAEVERLHAMLPQIKEEAFNRVSHGHPDGAKVRWLADFADEHRAEPMVVHTHDPQTAEMLSERLGQGGHKVGTVAPYDEFSDNEDERSRAILSVFPHSGTPSAHILVTSDPTVVENAPTRRYHLVSHDHPYINVGEDGIAPLSIHDLTVDNNHDRIHADSSQVGADPLVKAAPTELGERLLGHLQDMAGVGRIDPDSAAWTAHWIYPNGQVSKNFVDGHEDMAKRALAREGYDEEAMDAFATPGTGNLLDNFLAHTGAIRLGQAYNGYRVHIAAPPTDRQMAVLGRYGMDSDKNDKDFLYAVAAPGQSSSGNGWRNLLHEPFLRNRLEKGIKHDIKEAVASINPDPSHPQIHAGNYRKAHIRLHGLDITLENKRGGTRRGVDPTGKHWHRKLTHHYGYIRRVGGVSAGRDADGDKTDVFVGPHVKSRRVFVVDQISPGTHAFDEHKVLLGFRSTGAAKKGYLSNYDPDWKGLGAITEVSMPAFKAWLRDGGGAKKPFAPESELKKAIVWEPGEMQEYADQYSGSYPDDDPAGGNADAFHWRYEPQYPVEKLGDKQEWLDWYNEERKHYQQEWGNNRRYNAIERSWIRDPEQEPLVGVEGEDGKTTVWDGSHRVGMAHKHGLVTVPMVVGVRKTPPAQEKPADDL